MHKITHRRLVIEFDTWEPFDKMMNEEIGALGAMLRTKQLLAHAGKLHMTDIETDVKTID